jgi:hypothetical protein
MLRNCPIRFPASVQKNINGRRKPAVVNRRLMEVDQKQSVLHTKYDITADAIKRIYALDLIRYILDLPIREYYAHAGFNDHVAPFPPLYQTPQHDRSAAYGTYHPHLASLAHNLYISLAQDRSGPAVQQVFPGEEPGTSKPSWSFIKTKNKWSNVFHMKTMPPIEHTDFFMVRCIATLKTHAYESMDYFRFRVDIKLKLYVCYL